MSGSLVNGVVGFDIYLSTLTEEIPQSQLGFQGYAFILDGEGTAIVHPTEQERNLAGEPIVAPMYKEGQEEGVFRYTFGGEDKIIIYKTPPTVGWKVGATYSRRKLRRLH